MSHEIPNEDQTRIVLDEVEKLDEKFLRQLATDGEYSPACEAIVGQALTLIANFLIENPGTPEDYVRRFTYRDGVSGRSVRFESTQHESTSGAKASAGAMLALKIASIAHERLNPPKQSDKKIGKRRSRTNKSVGAVLGS